MPGAKMPTAVHRALFTLLEGEISQAKISISELEETKSNLKAFYPISMPAAAQNQSEALFTLLDDEISQVIISTTKIEETVAKLKSISMPRAQQQALFSLIDEELTQMK